MWDAAASRSNHPLLLRQGDGGDALRDHRVVVGYEQAELQHAEPEPLDRAIDPLEHDAIVAAEIGRDLARLGANPNVTVRNYMGGHMTYLDDASRIQMKSDLAAWYRSALGN